MRKICTLLIHAAQKMFTINFFFLAFDCTKFMRIVTKFKFNFQVPVQRVTKYPLLLSRLYKVSPPHIVGREAIKEALQSIELHLEHINYVIMSNFNQF